jgi:hypothetical protein
MDKKLLKLIEKRKTLCDTRLKLERQLEIAQKETVDPRQLRTSLRALLDRLKNADGETQRGIARAIFKRIEIKKENRVTIEWVIPDSDGGNSTFQREEWRDGRGWTYHFATR